jgi:hypothetical protein
MPDDGDLDRADGAVLPGADRGVRVTVRDGGERRVADLRGDSRAVLGGAVHGGAGGLRDAARVARVVEVPVTDEDRRGRQVRQLLRGGRDVSGAGQPRHPGIEQENRTADGQGVGGAADPRQHDPVAARCAGGGIDGVGAEEPGTRRDGAWIGGVGRGP